jgi:hypothetical protein
VIAAAIVLLLDTGGGGVVVSTRKPAATATDGGSAASGGTPSTPMSDTIPPATTIPPTESTGTTTTVPGTRPPQIGDFTGSLTAGATTVRVGEGVDLELRIHNASGAVIDTSRDARPNLELYCDVLQNPGPPGSVGVAYYDTSWYLPAPTMQPGDDGVITGHFVPTADFVGRASCQAVILQPALPRFFPEWDAITAIAPVVITVLPGEATTTIASTAAPTTTLPPPST